MKSTEVSPERLAQTVVAEGVRPTSEIQNLEEIRASEDFNRTKIIQQHFIHVQQTFGDVTVQGARNLTIGGTQNIGKPGPSQEEGKSLTWTEKIMRRTNSRIEEWTQGMVKTSGLEKVMAKLTNGVTWITIKGSPGEGKTTVAFMALGELRRSGRKVFQVVSPEEFLEVTMTCSNPIIMLNDVFGNLEFDQAEWSRWKPVIHQVLDGQEHRSHEGKKHSKDMEVIVILVSRDYVLNSVSCDMGRISDYFAHDVNVVHMSDTDGREVDEKLAIWKAISDSSGVELDSKTVETICHIRVPHGFPHVCRLFVTLYHDDVGTNAEHFFKAPLEFLNQTVKKFIHDKTKLFLFKEMIKRDGKVSLRELENVDSCADTIDATENLVGTYLRQEDGYFYFNHPSIYDSVAFNICKLYPKFVIENCNLSFIRERIRFKMPNNKEQYGESGLVVHIPRCYDIDLANRFSTEISNRQLVHVLSHMALTDELFVKEVMTCITLPLAQLLKVTDIKTGDTFLSLLVSNKSPNLLKYIDNQTDIQLTQNEINAVLYGVYRYAASDVLAYLLQTRDGIEINARYSGATPLMIAAGTRDIQFVHEIMSLNPDLNATDALYKTVLHYLCENGLVLAAGEVIDRGADIDVKDISGLTPLFHACRSNQMEVVRLLLDRKAKIDAKTLVAACSVGNMEVVSLLFMSGATVTMATAHQTPLTSACWRGHVKVIRFLLEKGAPVNTAPELGRPPIHEACKYNKPQVIKCLLEHASCIDMRDREDRTPLHTAAEWGYDECVELLIRQGAKLNVQNTTSHTPLHDAASRGFVGIVEVLVKNGADVNVQTKYDDTPLHMAALKGYSECVDALVQAGADVNRRNVYGDTALYDAAKGGSRACVDVLVKAGSNVNVQIKYGDTPLHTAALNGHPESVELLLKCGADVNIKNAYSYTPLYEAAKGGSRSCVDLLLKAGSVANVQIEDGDTPLHVAAWKGCSGCVDVLVKGGAIVNTRNIYGDTALFIAAKEGSTGCVDVLLKAGADVNVQTNDGDTPLHIAAVRGHLECVDVLVKGGGDVNRQNRYGDTAICGAAQQGYIKCVDVLLEAGAICGTANKEGHT